MNKIPFHENGKLYYWIKASGQVQNSQGLKIDNGFYPNLKSARVRVKKK